MDRTKECNWVCLYECLKKKKKKKKLAFYFYKTKTYLVCHMLIGSKMNKGNKWLGCSTSMGYNLSRSALSCDKDGCHCQLYNVLQIPFSLKMNIKIILTTGRKLYFWYFDVDNLPPDQLFVKLMSAQDYDDIIKPVVQFVSTAYTIRYNVKWLRWMLCIITYLIYVSLQ